MTVIIILLSFLFICNYGLHNKTRSQVKRIKTVVLHWGCCPFVSDVNSKKTSIITFTLNYLNRSWIICSGFSSHSTNSVLAGSNQFTWAHLELIVLDTGSRKRYLTLFLASDKLISSPRIPSLLDYFLFILLPFYMYCVLNNAEAQMSNFRTWI